jgi:hypothetical protein
MKWGDACWPYHPPKTIMLHVLSLWWSCRGFHSTTNEHFRQQASILYSAQQLMYVLQTWISSTPTLCSSCTKVRASFALHEMSLFQTKRRAPRATIIFCVAWNAVVPDKVVCTTHYHYILRCMKCWCFRQKGVHHALPLYYAVHEMLVFQTNRRAPRAIIIFCGARIVVVPDKKVCATRYHYILRCMNCCCSRQSGVHHALPLLPWTLSDLSKRSIFLGLARTVYTPRIWPFVWWFSCPKIPYIHRIYL